MTNDPLSPTFTDTAGRSRTLRFDVDAVRAAKADLGVRITDLWLGNLVFRIRTEPDLAVDLAFLACPDVDDPVTFAKLVGVDRLADVSDAVIAAASDFSCALARSDTPRKVARARDETFSNMIELAEAQANPITAEQLERFAEIATSDFASSSGPPTSSPGSSA